MRAPHHNQKRHLQTIVICMALAGAGVLAISAKRHVRHQSGPQAIAAPLVKNAKPRTASEKIVAGAKAQLGTIYDPGYYDISYPRGDVPHDRGACTDVVIRALRRAGYDLQRLIHEDMKRRFSDYPRKSRRTDSNIDHRRVPNQICFFKKYGLALPRAVTSHTLRTWRPGDIVYWKLDNGLDHCGVLSDHRNAQGAPLVIHNLATCVEEDCLTTWRITGHFRYPKA